VKLPAAVAFPTDDRLLRRIEASRRALPPDNMKSLRKSRERSNAVAATAQRVPDVGAQPEPRPMLQLVRIDELYLRNKVALR
jgi:hypothetical protein